MRVPEEIVTSRLTLRPASVEELGASLWAPEVLRVALGCDVAADWPPRHWERGAVEWLAGRLAGEPDEPMWRAWLVVLGRWDLRGTLVGTIGFKGPPGAMPDSEGVLEIGYSVVESHWRRGIASEAVGAMLEWARRDVRARLFRAHTLAGDPASGGVLLKNGFVCVGQNVDPDEGAVDRYERALWPVRSA